VSSSLFQQYLFQVQAIRPDINSLAYKQAVNISKDGQMRLRMFIILLCLFGSALVVYSQDEAATVPANLAVPEGNSLSITLIGDGVQIYRCQESADTKGTYQWVFVEPHADLMNAAGLRMGIHYAGPSWEANDGSVVHGEVVEKADAPNQAIPWLLLKAAPVTGNGLFSHVTFVQRLDTFAGVAPSAEGCTEQQNGHVSRVPYRALYRFYTADPVDMNPTNVPTNLQAPEGNRVAYQVHAEGVQIYRCQESTETKGTFSWTFVAPEADLMNAVNERVGIHYGGPTWESKDGSWVAGEVQERADSPDGAIPWLLLKGVSPQGNGTLGNISFIQRLDTVGGTAPAADSCTMEHKQQVARIPYSALYVFYSAE
jgi:predicted peroxiredoxin